MSATIILIAGIIGLFVLTVVLTLRNRNASNRNQKAPRLSLKPWLVKLLIAAMIYFAIVIIGCIKGIEFPEALIVAIIPIAVTGGAFLWLSLADIRSPYDLSLSDKEATRRLLKERKDKEDLEQWRSANMGMPSAGYDVRRWDD